MIELTEFEISWANAVAAGWNHASEGEFDAALAAYREADELMSVAGFQCIINPELSVLRHKQGTGPGCVISMPPTEDAIVSLQMATEDIESLDARGMRKPVINIGKMRAGIRECIANYKTDYHADNIKQELPHIQVLSTGRCGTISLYHLFEVSDLVPYHTYMFQLPHVMRYEMVYRNMEEDFSQACAETWVKSRAAEWIGAINQGLPMIGLNHLDTVFAQVFAAVHPKSKFIYLHRDPVDVFNSFYAKNQWGPSQVCALNYKFDDDMTRKFRWRQLNYDQPAAIAWYVRWTEAFCQAMADVLGDRVIKISSEELFAGEVDRLLEFCEVDIPQASEHFRIPYNQKKHKIVKTDQQMEEGREAFLHVYNSIGDSNDL